MSRSILSVEKSFKSYSFLKTECQPARNLQGSAALSGCEPCIRLSSPIDYARAGAS